MSELPASPGLFAERDVAERAYLHTLERDRGATWRRDALDDPARRNGLTVDCTGLGAALGGTCGVVAAAATAMDSLALPGFGLVIAGPLVAAVIGASLGALGGALAGMLLGVRAARDRPHAAAAGERSGRHAAT